MVLRCFLFSELRGVCHTGKSTHSVISRDRSSEHHCKQAKDHLLLPLLPLVDSHPAFNNVRGYV